MTTTRGGLLYIVHDTNDPNMREIASYRAVTVSKDRAVLTFIGQKGELIAIHHLMPGHSVTPVRD